MIIMHNLTPISKRNFTNNLIIFETVMFWTDNSGILYCKFNNTNPEVKLNCSKAHQYIKAITKLCKGTPMPFLIDVRDNKGTFSIAAAKIITNSPELEKLRISESFITNTIGMRLLIIAYKRIFNPVTPYSVFSELESARNFCIETKNKFYGINKI